MNTTDNTNIYGFVPNDENKIVFTIARMNPPTPGHLYLIRRLIQEAIKNGVKNVYIFLSKTKDIKNPILCSEKVTVLGNDDSNNTMIKSEKQKMISDYPHLEADIREINVHAICTLIPLPLAPLYSLVRTKSEVTDLKFIIVIGQDRANWIDTIVDSFLLKNPNVSSVKEIVLGREIDIYDGYDITQFCGLNINEVPVSSMSASFVRRVVRDCPQQKFNEIYTPYLDENKIGELYESVKTGITPQVDTTTKKRKSSAIVPEEEENQEEENQEKENQEELSKPVYERIEDKLKYIYVNITPEGEKYKEAILLQNKGNPLRLRKTEAPVEKSNTSKKPRTAKSVTVADTVITSAKKPRTAKKSVTVAVTVADPVIPSEKGGKRTKRKHRKHIKKTRKCKRNNKYSKKKS